MYICYIYTHTILPRKHVQELFFIPTFWPYFRCFAHVERGSSEMRMNEGPQKMSDTFGRSKNLTD